MAVSYPRGAEPPKPGLAPKGPMGGPTIKSAVAAPLAAPKIGVPQTSNSYTRAAHHHMKIGAAIKAKNPKLAMIHTGHLLQALKHAATPTGVTAPGNAPDEIDESETASGTDDGPTSSTLPMQTKQPSMAQSPPSGPKKPSNLKAFFGAMKAKAGGYQNG